MNKEYIDFIWKIGECYVSRNHDAEEKYPRVETDL